MDDTYPNSSNYTDYFSQVISPEPQPLPSYSWDVLNTPPGRLTEDQLPSSASLTPLPEGDPQTMYNWDLVKTDNLVWELSPDPILNPRARIQHTGDAPTLQEIVGGNRDPTGMTEYASQYWPAYSAPTPLTDHSAQAQDQLLNTNPLDETTSTEPDAESVPSSITVASNIELEILNTYPLTEDEFDSQPDISDTRDRGNQGGASGRSLF